MQTRWESPALWAIAGIKTWELTQLHTELRITFCNKRSVAAKILQQPVFLHLDVHVWSNSNTIYQFDHPKQVQDLVILTQNASTYFHQISQMQQAWKLSAKMQRKKPVLSMHIVEPKAFLFRFLNSITLHLISKLRKLATSTCKQVKEETSKQKTAYATLLS